MAARVQKQRRRQVTIAEELREDTIVKAIQQLLNRFDIWHFKHWGGPYCRAGIPDIIGVLPGGRMFVLEVKRPGGKATKKQQTELNKVKASGGIAAVVRNTEDVIRVLGLPDLFCGVENGVKRGN